ncbi:ankyrin repeat-containing domain protein, partial [Baffinella frigidus]
AALEGLRKSKMDKERQDLESLQELERLQRDKERLDKRSRDQQVVLMVNSVGAERGPLSETKPRTAGEMERLTQEVDKKEKSRKEEDARMAEQQSQLQAHIDKHQKKQLARPPSRDDDDNMSVMSDMTDMTSKDEPAVELSEKEKEKWANEGKSELDKKFFGIFSRARHGRYAECERVLKTELDGEKVPVDCQDEFGNTPLVVACQNGKKRLAKLFLRYKANINAVNGQGNTVLHFCFTYGYGDLGDYLISKGANANLKNNNGLTCYDGLDQTRQASFSSYLILPLSPSTSSHILCHVFLLSSHSHPN